MIVEIAETIMAEVIEGNFISVSPRWMLDSLIVTVGPYQSAQEYDQHIAKTIGSLDWLWSEAEGFRFNQDNLLLQGVWFRVPEIHLPINQIPSLWQIEQSRVGLLQLLSSNKFHLAPTDVRWIEPDTNTMICMKKEAALTGEKEGFRLRIANDFELLFVDKKLCGWLLSSPEQYLVNSWEAIPKNIPDKELIELLYESLHLVSESNIERMFDEDTAILYALTNLHSRIKSDYGARHQRMVLRSWIEGIIERFYE